MNLLGYVLAIGLILWAVKAFKQWMVERALKSVDKKSEALAEDRKEIQNNINKNKTALEIIKEKEVNKSTQEAEDFWNSGKGS